MTIFVNVRDHCDVWRMGVVVICPVTRRVIEKPLSFDKLSAISFKRSVYIAFPDPMLPIKISVRINIAPVIN